MVAVVARISSRSSESNIATKSSSSTPFSAPLPPPHIAARFSNVTLAAANDDALPVPLPLSLPVPTKRTTPHFRFRF